MKILFTHKLRRELIELGYLYVAYFDGSDRTILYPFKSAIPEEKLAQLHFHQLPIDDLVVDYMAEDAVEKKIYISNRYFAVLSEYRKQKILVD
jgi:hypothetical protein